MGSVPNSHTGMRQTGVLFSVLFAVYVNGIITNLVFSVYGC